MSELDDELREEIKRLQQAIANGRLVEIARGTIAVENANRKAAEQSMHLNAFSAGVVGFGLGLLVGIFLVTI